MRKENINSMVSKNDFFVSYYKISIFNIEKYTSQIPAVWIVLGLFGAVSKLFSLSLSSIFSGFNNLAGVGKPKI